VENSCYISPVRLPAKDQTSANKNLSNMLKFLENSPALCLYQNLNEFLFIISIFDSQLSRGLRRGSAVTRSLGLRVWIPPTAWISFSYLCCVLSGTILCDGLITHPEESYQLWCVWVWSWSPHDAEAHYYLSNNDNRSQCFFFAEISAKPPKRDHYTLLLASLMYINMYHI